MNLGNRNSQHSFARVPTANIQRSKFDRSFAVKDTFDFDYLTPMFVEEILPGDTINISAKTFMRLAPQVRPIMDNMYIDFYWFFVPNRLVWDNWEKFCGSQDNPGDSTDFLIPTIDYPSTGFVVGSIFDKYGIPTEKTLTVSPTPPQINALPFRAYNLIYNEWFRDQNLISSALVPKGNGPDADTLYPLRKGAKKHDYFTSALPWPQKGDSVSMPLSGFAPVLGIGKGSPNYSGTPLVGIYESNGEQTSYGRSSLIDGDTNTDFRFYVEANGSTDYPNIRADLSEATSASINTFRQAMMLQSFLERDARGGTRYVEILKSHFNVISPDFRLQRPEFLSSATININQHPIAQTSESNETPQGNLSAFSTAQETGSRIGFSKSFVEHGYVIGLAKARGEITYQQGLPRMWTRQTKLDFFWPEFQELGEQAVLNREIFFQPGEFADDQVFGYQERHAEYRYRPSEVRGQFRSDYPQSLDVWHLAQEFSALPTLSAGFIEYDTPIERALVVPDEEYPDLLADYWFDYKHVRAMVAYPVPASLGRF